MNGYNPFGTRIQGGGGFVGQLQGVREKALDLEAIENYINQASGQLQDAGSASAKGSLFAKAGGFFSSKLLKGKTLFGMTKAITAPQALIAGAIISGGIKLAQGLKTKKDVQNIGQNAPKVKYGKQQLRRAQESIDKNVKFFKEAPVPQALTAAFDTGTDLFKMDILNEQLRELYNKGVGLGISENYGGMSQQQINAFANSMKSPMFPRGMTTSPMRY